MSLLDGLKEVMCRAAVYWGGMQTGRCGVTFSRRGSFDGADDASLLKVWPELRCSPAPTGQYNCFIPAGTWHPPCSMLPESGRERKSRYTRPALIRQCQNSTSAPEPDQLRRIRPSLIPCHNRPASVARCCLPWRSVGLLPVTTTRQQPDDSVLLCDRVTSKDVSDLATRPAPAFARPVPTPRSPDFVDTPRSDTHLAPSGIVAEADRRQPTDSNAITHQATTPEDPRSFETRHSNMIPTSLLL
jgi:hypothetical protein